MNEPSAAHPLEEETAVANRLPRLRFPVLCVLIFWVASLVVGAFDKPYFFGFLYEIASSSLVTLCFLVWWWFNRRLRFSEKVLGFALMAGEAWVTGRLSDHSINYFTLWLAGFPLVVTIVVAWLCLVKRFGISWARIGFLAVVTLIWSCFLVIRVDGADSRLKAKKHWRWTPTLEDQFLAKSGPASSLSELAPTNGVLRSEVAPGDWVSFRGTNRDGVIRGSMLATNWNENRPVAVWKHAVGPAWSSLIVVGNRLYTQEQRGEKETVVCYDAFTGEQLWIHEDLARFDESVSGPGPRATPTFAKGRLYTLGGTGLLNCLDADSGNCLWKRDVKAASEARIPSWAFASSPLVTDELVVVYAGGDAGKGLLAYRIQAGELAWTAVAGGSSYSSPQLNSIAGVSQCLMLHDGGVTAVEVATGNKLWETGLVMKGAPRTCQPRLVEQNKLLVAAPGGLGCSLIEVTKNGDQWLASTKWESKDLKPEFPDFVVHHGYAFGFDIGIFCCISLADGKRAWKEGRYGRGQVMLLPEQDLLLVSSETGELVLLAADWRGHQEIGRFQALEGKTWSHPVVRGNQVYLRNAQEMACYSFSGKQ